MNVRNFLLPMTEAEVQVELNLSVERGDTARAGYVEEFLCELQAECNACPVCEDETVGPDCSGCHVDEGLGVSVDFAGCPHPDDCPGSGDCDEEAEFGELLGGDNYPGCGSDEDCIGCPESGDCADEAH
jgi:hypothetical protein